MREMYFSVPGKHNREKAFSKKGHDGSEGKDEGERASHDQERQGVQ